MGHLYMSHKMPLYNATHIVIIYLETLIYVLKLIKYNNIYLKYKLGNPKFLIIILYFM